MANEIYYNNITNKVLLNTSDNTFVLRTEAPTLDGSLYVNINAYSEDPQPKEWTWTPSGSTEQVKWFNSFKVSTETGITLYYDDNTLSDYTLDTIQESNIQSNNGRNDTDGIYPGGANGTMLYNNNSWYADTPQMQLTGLDTSTTYKLTFFGSRDAWVATTRYTITGGTSEDGSYVDLDTNGNYLYTASISNITPSSSGTIDFTYYWQDSQAFLGVLQIDEGQ